MCWYELHPPHIINAAALLCESRKTKMCLPPHVENFNQVWGSYGSPFLSNEYWQLPQNTIVSVFADTAHAPYHVTYA